MTDVDVRAPLGATAATPETSSSSLDSGPYYIDDHSKLGAVGTVLSVAVPLAVFVIVLYGLYSLFARTLDPFHLLLIGGSAALLVIPVLMAAAGVGVLWCLLVLTAVPWVTVLGLETVGHRHNAEVLERLRAEGAGRS